MLEKCEQATQGYVSSNTQSTSPNGTPTGGSETDSFSRDVQAFVVLLEKEKRPLLTNNAELDGLVSPFPINFILHFKLFYILRNFRPISLLSFTSVSFSPSDAMIRISFMLRVNIIRLDTIIVGRWRMLTPIIIILMDRFTSFQLCYESIFNTTFIPKNYVLNYVLRQS